MQPERSRTYGFCSYSGRCGCRLDFGHIAKRAQGRSLVLASVAGPWRRCHELQLPRLRGMLPPTLSPENAVFARLIRSGPACGRAPPAPRRTTSAALSAINGVFPPLLQSGQPFGYRNGLGGRDRDFGQFSNGCGCSSGVEHDLAKVGVEGSNPFARSSLRSFGAKTGKPFNVAKIVRDSFGEGGLFIFSIPPRASRACGGRRSRDIAAA